MSNEGLATQNYGSVVNFEDYAMSTEAVVRQVNVIQEVMKAVMKIDEHYGTIPGCQKPSLYKPGAEKLGFTFRLAPEYEVRTINMANGHREYQVKCRLRHIPTGAMVGEGEGSCTTMEGKYRFRGGEKEGTGEAIPKEYWNLKNAGKMEEARALIGGPGFAPGKVDGKWEICSIGEKVEHDNPADYYNTCLKMAKKRAHVDAILTATAASDIFTQDVEDMPEVIPGASTTQQTGTQATTGKPPVKQPQEKKGMKDPDVPASEPQIKAISTMWGKLGLEDSMKYAYCTEAAGLTEVIKSMKDLTKAQASSVIEKLNKDIEEKKAVEG